MRAGLAGQGEWHRLAGALGDQSLEVVGQGLRRRGGVAHRQVKQHLAEHGVLEFRIGSGLAHGGEAFATEAGDTFERSGRGRIGVFGRRLDWKGHGRMHARASEGWGLGDGK